MPVIPFVHKRMLSEDTPTEELNKPIKTYRYRLNLEVYEDEPFTIPNDRFCIDTLSIFKDKEVVNEALKRSFELLLERFNLEDKGE